MSAADGNYGTVPLTATKARVCPTCGALIYNRDDAEAAHRRHHDSVITQATLDARTRAARATP